MSTFISQLKTRWQQGLFISVGLDADFSKIPKFLKDKFDGDLTTVIFEFNRRIIDQTHDLVCAYKPNSAFYEAHGSQGWAALKLTTQYLKEKYPEIPIILDAKRADIGNTNLGYVEMAFKELAVDAITVHPYLGREAIQPFLDQKDKGIIVLVKTSNPGSDELQNLKVGTKQEKLFEFLARKVAREWNSNHNCGVVVGATYPQELARVREIIGELPILIPGIGAQGGDLAATVKAGKDKHHQGMIINSARGIIFASAGKDFATQARKETMKLNQLINQYLKE